MKRLPLLLLSLLVSLPLTASAASDDLRVSTRDVPGSHVQEVKVVGRIEAPPERVLAVLADVDAYEETMPDTKVARLVKREGNEIWLYSVVDPPLASDRDYCVHITLSEGPGGVLMTHWEPANELAPPKRDGVVRVEVNEGSWSLTPLDGGKATGAVYRLHVDPGGRLPKWIVRRANEVSVPDAFRAVRKAATSARYAHAPSPLRPAARAPSPTGEAASADAEG